jgi:hypothetical protein
VRPVIPAAEASPVIPAAEASLVDQVSQAVQVRSCFGVVRGFVFFTRADAVTPNAGASSTPLQGTTTGLFARWSRVKFQRLPAESWFESATPARLTTVPNLNFPSTGDAFANSGLKSDYAARFEGYQPQFAYFLILAYALVSFRFINIPKSGKWTFELESDDGSRLLINDVKVHLAYRCGC